MIYKECKLCGHKWLARKEDPLCCPNCKRYDWNKKEGKKNVLQNTEENKPKRRSERSKERDNKSDQLRRLLRGGV